MSEVREMWVGSVFVAEWDVTDTAGEPVTDATVAGTVSTPAGASMPMVTEHTAGSGTYRLSYKAGAAGDHTWKATAAGTAEGATGGQFFVSRDQTGAPPITTDLETPIGKVRLLTTDGDEAFPLHTDPELAAFLAMEGGNVKRAAAGSLEAIATSETLVTKKITTQDLSTDGPAVAEDLRKRAALLRGQADREDQTVADTDLGYGFDFVDHDPAPRWGRWT